MIDPIVEEVRKARQDHATEFNHDLAEIYADLKRIEKVSEHKVVSPPPKLITNSSNSPHRRLMTSNLE